MYGRTKEANPFYGQKHTEETRKKMSEARKGIKYSKQEKLNFAKVHTSTGIFRVYKHKQSDENYLWGYTYTDEDNKKIKYLLLIMVMFYEIRF